MSFHGDSRGPSPADILGVVDILEQSVKDRDSPRPMPNDMLALVAWCRVRALEDPIGEQFMHLVGASMTAAHKLAQSHHKRVPSPEEVAEIAFRLATAVANKAAGAPPVAA